MVSVEKVTEWGRLQRHIVSALGSEQDRQELAEQFSRGECTGWRIGEAWVLIRGEPGPELVIVAMEGRGLAQALQIIKQSAKAQGYASMRAHTKRPGLLRLAQKTEPGAYLREYVIGLEL